MPNNLIKNRLKYATRVGKMLATFPFVRSVILNGSLALGTSKESSDIDILIVAKSGRIFTARFFVNGLTTIWGIKRSKDEELDHSGDFCFNYFLTENFLKIPTNRTASVDKYCAENYSKSVYLAGDSSVYENFMKANVDLFNKYGCTPRSLTDNESKKRKGLSQVIWEFILSGYLGEIFENMVKRYQIKKIESSPITAKYPDLIVYNDKELRFHPPKSIK